MKGKKKKLLELMNLQLRKNTFNSPWILHEILKRRQASNSNKILYKSLKEKLPKEWNCKKMYNPALSGIFLRISLLKPLK